MLFIQSIDTYYEKQGRSSEYARLRTVYELEICSEKQILVS